MKSIVQLKPKESLNPKNEIANMKNFEVSWLIEKLSSSEEFLNLSDIKETYDEFLKFVYIQKMSNKPVAMMSKKVDEIWHQFILFTQEYYQFCNEFLGFFLHHKPGTKSSPVSKNAEIRFFDLYKEYFGEVHKVWLSSSTCDGAGTCADQSGGDCRSCGGDGSGDCSTGGNDSGGPAYDD